MRFPRMTTKRWMVAVAIVAVLLCPGIPIANRVAWLYRTPVPEISGHIGHEPHALKPIPVNRPVTLRCSYQAAVATWTPSGLLFRVRVRVKVLGTNGAIVERYQRTHYLISGGDWAEVQDNLTHAVIPRRVGQYRVWYEVVATDLFGRSTMPALSSDILVVE